MAARISRLIGLCLALFISLSAQASIFSPNNNSRFVPVDQAFGFDFSQQGNQLTLSWKVKSGYYLYRQKIQVTPQKAQIAPLALPPGQAHEDEFYGKSEIYPQDLQLPVIIHQADQGATLTVTYQGCAAAGFCYPPETRAVPLNAVATNNAAPAVSAQPDNRSTPLPFSPLWALLIGIGVAFTPCVLPMYPLISSIILGGPRRFSLGRLFALAMVYVQGMALTYTLLGVVVAAAGLRFQAALQHPYVLIGLSVLFIALALSMFGLFTLQLPASLQTRLTLWSNRHQGGSLPGVFAMGALAGLICSPCTTAPLSAILLYIAQSGNLLVGAGTLWLYAFGMGLPLIAVTLFGNKLLPKSGPWMHSVKEGFGFVILALPVFLLERVIGDLWGMRLWSLLGVAFFAWAFRLSLGLQGKGRVVQVVMLVAAVVAARPLQDWAFGVDNPVQTVAHLPFQPIASSQQLDTALQQAQGRMTMVDLYADWCVACKEFEKYTFSDAQVRSALSQVQLLQANVTANNAQDNALLQHLQVLGLPTILFFDAQGKEIPDSRVTGFLNADEFRAHLHNLPR
ncbi:Cytochrome c-type biogenesis protein DsbD, protein-disulfide reductase [Pantoea sp. AS-PWVM4]|uniref:protein-disulfide reductase DsbD n=1 Tax=Pantoea sp. AS-PWVM4 TaxID=1332069 RepID=UPI0003AC8D44|nr:protein-disulfide reductase DsbD [Pantoea sp. AS-PWVM4]ERK15173.1 Cytochrome c-type biogenesis protein DsbD, protein-disulfide reductase [Pantoea sp. AS-PWVM4]